jgi:hypothetical protein
VRNHPALAGAATAFGIILAGLAIAPILMRVLIWWWKIWLPV